MLVDVELKVFNTTLFSVQILVHVACRLPRVWLNVVASRATHILCRQESQHTIPTETDTGTHMDVVHYT